MHATAKTAPLYHERLYVPWWWWVIGAGLGALMAGQFRLALYELPAWLPFAVLVPLTLLVVWRIGRGVVEIRPIADGAELRVRGAHMTLDAVGAVAELDAKTVRMLAGRHGDPAAYVVMQPWIGPGVQVIVDDPDDPTPYWLFSSRHPDQLAAALRAARGGRRDDQRDPGAEDR